MLKKLSDKKLIQYQRYQGVKRTAEGRRVALGIVRKHRLWEVFLLEKLDYRWDEVHEIAEQLEHITSDNLTDRLDKFLCFPKFEPHGDPKLYLKIESLQAYERLDEIIPRAQGLIIGRGGLGPVRGCRDRLRPVRRLPPRRGQRIPVAVLAGLRAAVAG